MRVCVAHPGLQHSYQVALAFVERHALVAYESGVPVYDTRGAKRETLARGFSRGAPIDRALRANLYWIPLLTKIASRVLTRSVSSHVANYPDSMYGCFLAKKIAGSYMAAGYWFAAAVLAISYGESRARPRQGADLSQHWAGRLAESQ